MKYVSLQGEGGSLVNKRWALEHRFYALLAGFKRVHVFKKGSRSTNHRVDRVLGLFSCRPNRDAPTPSPAGEYVPLSLVFGGDTLAYGEGVGVPVPNRVRHCGTLFLLYTDIKNVWLFSYPTPADEWTVHLCNLFPTACTLMNALCKDWIVHSYQAKQKQLTKMINHTLIYLLIYFLFHRSYLWTLLVSPTTANWVSSAYGTVRPSICFCCLWSR